MHARKRSFTEFVTCDLMGIGVSRLNIRIFAPDSIIERSSIIPCSTSQKNEYFFLFQPQLLYLRNQQQTIMSFRGQTDEFIYFYNENFILLRRYA